MVFLLPSCYWILDSYYLQVISLESTIGLVFESGLFSIVSDFSWATSCDIAASLLKHSEFSQQCFIRCLFYFRSGFFFKWHHRQETNLLYIKNIFLMAKQPFRAFCESHYYYQGIFCFQTGLQLHRVDLILIIDSQHILIISLWRAYYLIIYLFS